MVGCTSNPVYDGLFLVPFDASQATDAAAFCYQGQRFDDFVFGRVSAIENCSFGICKGITTGLAFETLPTSLGLAEPNDVSLVLALRLSMVCTGRIWTEVAYLGKLWHSISLQVVDGCYQYTSFLNNTQEGDYPKSGKFADGGASYPHFALLPPQSGAESVSRPRFCSPSGAI